MNKKYMKALMIIAFPLMVQNMLRGLLGSADKLFIGQLGESALAGVGGANQLFSLFLTIFMAVSAGLTVLLSQYIGGKKEEKFEKVIGTMMTCAIVGGIGIILVFQGAGIHFLKALNISGLALESAHEYLHIIAYSILFILFSSIFSGVFLAFKKNTYPMIATFISMGINLLLNGLFFLILNWGIMGIAYATLIARGIEFGILLLLVKSILRKKGISLSLGFDRHLFLGLFHISVPMVLDGAAWQLAMTFYTRIVFTIGVQEVAVYEILKIFQTLTITGVAAMAAANVGIVGQELGKSAYRVAKEKAESGVWSALIMVTLMNGLILVFSRPVFGVFSLEPETVTMGISAIPLVITIIYAQVLNVMFPYILRSGGDTWANLWITIIGFWGLQIPLAWILGIMLNLGIMGVLASMLVAESTKGLLFYLRYKRGSWMKNLAENQRY